MSRGLGDVYKRQVEKDGKLTTESLYEEWFHCEDLGTQLAPIIKRYWKCCRLEFGCIVIS